MKMIVNGYKPNEIFKFIRENTGLTQVEFGNKFNKKRRTIQSYEYNELKFDFKFLLEIIKELNLVIIIKDKFNKLSINATNYKSNEILNIIRKYTNLPIKDFSKRINKSRSTVQNYEYGNRNYNFELLLLIAKEFDLEIIIKDKEKS